VIDPLDEGMIVSSLADEAVVEAEPVLAPEDADAASSETS